MCLAIPSRIVAVDGLTATVERYGERLDVSLAMMPEPVQVGDYVIVQSRAFVVQIVDRETAEESLRLFDQILESMGAVPDDAPSETADEPTPAE